MSPSQAEILICGAGIAGVSAAYELAVRRGRRGVVLVDAGEPLALTSSRGTEAYRTWWPAPPTAPYPDAMVRLTRRSVERLEELAAEDAERFGLTRRGYAFLSARSEGGRAFERTAEQAAALGAGSLRRDPGPDETDRPAAGGDLVTDPAALRRRLPWVSPDAVALLHVRRAGWLDSLRLGRWLLARAEAAGVTVVRGRMAAVEVRGGRVRTARLAGGQTIETGELVLACGPGSPAAGRLLGLELPLSNRPHGKLTLDDRAAALPRDAPLIIWSDPVRLDWSADERRRLAADPATAYLLDELPAGVHARPRGEREVLVLWSYGGEAMAIDERGTADERGASWSRFPRFHPLFAEVVVRGLARAVPGFAAYRGHAAEHGTVDGGYYCQAPDNRPLIGPLPVAGAWALAGLSGFGIMTSQGAAELLADHLDGGRLPGWAAAFHPDRFDDAGYRRKLADWDPAEGEL